jgi:hypothetical protein
MTPLLASCALSGSGSSVREIVSRELPPAPAYMQPVAVPEPKEGEQLLPIAARERAGRLKANTIIRKATAQWEKLRAEYRKSN